MKTKLLLLAVLCACQGGFTMFAMETNQPAHGNNPLLWQQEALTVCLLRHPRCATPSPFLGLPETCVQVIGKLLKDDCYNCKACNFRASDNSSLMKHESTPHVCVICGKTCKNATQYRMHRGLAHPPSRQQLPLKVFRDKW